MSVCLFTMRSVLTCRINDETLLDTAQLNAACLCCKHPEPAICLGVPGVVDFFGRATFRALEKGHRYLG